MFTKAVAIQSAPTAWLRLREHEKNELKIKIKNEFFNFYFFSMFFVVLATPLVPKVWLLP
jgi:hypothetical protein